jgi:DNA-binding NarL/FixJ family response regulator
VLPLTPSELAILKALSIGKTAKEIGSQLGIEPKTVATHRTNLMYKLDIHKTVLLTHYSIAHGLVDLLYDGGKLTDRDMTKRGAD